MSRISVAKFCAIGAVIVVLAIGGYVLMHGGAILEYKKPASGGIPAEGGASTAADTNLNADFIKTTLPVRQMATDTIPVTGKLSLDKQQLRIASARVAGRLGRIFVFEGQSVKTGQPLAEIYSPEYISAQQEFLLATRFKDTLSKTAPDAELRQDAEATYQSAGNKLKVLGASDADVAKLANGGMVAQYLNVRAPISGVVTQRNVDPGGYLNIGDALMTVANTDTLWLYFNSYDADYASLKLGQELTFQSSALPDRNFIGRVTFIAPSIDPATHTLPVRCDIPNSNHLLRPEMFIKGTLKIGERAAWVVPKTAVIHIRDKDYVIVKDDDKHFRRVAVQGHPLPLDQYAITGGLAQAVPVVSDGGLLVNELVNEG
jgi:Cu(I)/Ag(I) efflux system membrane fusion protein